jgi:hypothetical protein
MLNRERTAVKSLADAEILDYARHAERDCRYLPAAKIVLSFSFVRMDGLDAGVAQW